MIYGENIDPANKIGVGPFTIKGLSGVFTNKH